jgi:hypothetical protein
MPSGRLGILKAVYKFQSDSKKFTLLKMPEFYVFYLLLLILQYKCIILKTLQVV